MAIVTSDPNPVRTTAEGWRGIVRSAIRDPILLLQRLQLPIDLAKSELTDVQRANQSFRTFVPEPFLQRIKPGDRKDPLLLQVLPVANETIEVEGFGLDPVGDQQAERADGLIQKYHGRALLIARGICAVHCRYCFRRHFPYQSAPLSIQQFDQTLQVVRDDSTITELILSGGDPLMMVDEKLAELIDMIERIPHVRRLRIHTRLPIVIPQRVTSALKRMLEGTRLATFVVVHANHPNEIDDLVHNALMELNGLGITLLNQSVLLNGINDNLQDLVELSERLIDANCLPYYLHQLDRVQGAAHFQVDPRRGRDLVGQMRTLLPGYAVPRYVQEIAGEPGKSPIE